MKILLTTINSKFIHQNLAIRILYELNKNHPGIEIFEFSPKNSDSEITDYCSGFHLVAFSCYIWNITRTLKVAKLIREKNPSCTILLGGPEVSHEEDSIIALPQIDYIIRGEGEIPFSQFIKTYPCTTQVPGLVWKQNGEILRNSPIENPSLDFLTINPYLSIPADELKHKICYIEASRGCPCQCEFCLAGQEGKVRYLPEKTVQENLLHLMQNGRMIKFLDRTFNVRSSYAISIFTFITQHYRPGNVFQFEIKADLIRNNLVDFIRENVPDGLFRFEIGIQTLNVRSNQAVKRKQDFEKIKTFIAQVSDKVEIHLDLIIGLPYDSLSDIKYSFEEVFKIFAPELQLGFLKFLKGTPIRRKFMDHGYRYNPDPPYQIIENKYLSSTGVEELINLEHVLEVYWNKKRAANTLRYIAARYSIFDFLTELGKYWKNNGFYHAGLPEIYSALYGFCAQRYPENRILPDLIALDYYLQHKVKPHFRFLPEPGKAEKAEIYGLLKLNHHKYRYAIHKVHFSVENLIKSNTVVPATDLLVIEFTGTAFPRVLTHSLSS